MFFSCYLPGGEIIQAIITASVSLLFVRKIELTKLLCLDAIMSFSFHVFQLVALTTNTSRDTVEDS